MTTKRCYRCKITKPLKEFPPSADRGDGHAFECRECKRARDKEYRNRPEVRARRLLWSQQNSDRYKGKYVVDSTKYADTLKAWHERNPKARRAYKKLHKAIGRGEMLRAAECACVQCGQMASDYHHHNGYDIGHELDVIPLCRTCHKLTHSSDLRA